MIDSRGRTLTPCRRKVAEREVRLERAKWIGPKRIRLRFDPFAYRYVRLKVLERDGYTCYWCGNPGDTMDHVIPWSKGGRTSMTNCICACQECNGRRGDMPPEEFARLVGVPMPRPGLVAKSRPELVAKPRHEQEAKPLLTLEPKPKAPVEPEKAPAPREVLPLTQVSMALHSLLDPLAPRNGTRPW